MHQIGEIICNGFQGSQIPLWRRHRFYSVNIGANCATIQIEIVCQEVSLTVKFPSPEIGLKENEHFHVDKKIQGIVLFVSWSLKILNTFWKTNKNILWKKIKINKICIILEILVLKLLLAVGPSFKYLNHIWKSEDNNNVSINDYYENWLR